MERLYGRAIRGKRTDIEVSEFSGLEITMRIKYAIKFLKNAHGSDNI